MLDRNELTRLATAMGGLPVIACRPGSPADLAGVRYGDIVLAVNDVKTPDWAAFIEARKADSTKMKVELFRDGTTVMLEIPLSPQPAIDTPTLLAEMISENIVPLESTQNDVWRPRDVAKPN
jgi:predicted metalloprotease with PDZ domain